MPSVYLDTYLDLSPDIMCLAEVPLDDEHGNSAFLDKFAQAMGAVGCHSDVHEKSWLVEGKYYGSAILSKHSLTDYRAFKLPNPRLEVDRLDGQHWELHDKSVQAVVVRISGQAVRLFNLHYFPFHQFYRNMSEPEFEPCRTALIERLQLEVGLAPEPNSSVLISRCVF